MLRLFFLASSRPMSTQQNFKSVYCPTATSCSSWMENNSRGKTLTVTSAELPDPLNHNMHHHVKKFIIHQCRCMVEGRCSKDCPKQFCSQTILGEDSYPTCLLPASSSASHLAPSAIGVRTIDGHQCDTHKEACQCQNLLE